MLREIYLVLKDHLSTSVAQLKHIDWDLGQYNQEGDDHVKATPAAYIKFNTIEWSTYLRYIQRGVLEFEVTLVNQSAYGDENDMVDTTYIDHLTIERTIYAALQQMRFQMNDVPGWPDDEDENILMETIERISQAPHTEQDTLIVTSQTFRSTVFDYSAHPEYITHLATLDLNISVHKTLEDE